MDPLEIKRKIVRFRILIIGRANAGKTTILQRVCNTKENPDIYDSYGRKIDAAVLTASRERGEHDIENEMVFRNNPGFIFHDSRGFEAGGESEYDKVNAFIADRSKKGDIKDRIHTIWYCIPMDKASRCFTEAELKFFSRCDTGSIPVIVLFTKFDALYNVEFARLTENGTSRKDAKQLAPKHAEEAFANGPQLRFLYNSKDIRRPPTCHVCLPDMHEDNADCGPLIERTAETLDNEALQQLFVSTQQTNLEICMKYAVEKTLANFVEYDYSSEDVLISRLGTWFPHILVAGYYLDHDLRHHLGVPIGDTENLMHDQCGEMRSRLLSFASGLSPSETMAQIGSAAVIIFEHSFYIFDRQRHIQDRRKSVPSFYVALEQYMASPHAAAVREGVNTTVLTYQEAVSTAVRAYEEAVSTAVYANQGNSSAWKAKLPLGYFQRKAKRAFERSQADVKQSVCSQAKAELLQRILKIALEHRLPRP